MRKADKEMDRVKLLAEAYEATGRVAHIYTKQRRVSLSGGGSMSFQDAIKRMSEVVGA